MYAPTKGETVGLFRKALSVSTIGAVDFRSDKERTAAYTKQTMKEAKKQTGMMKQARSESNKDILRAEYLAEGKKLPWYLK
jgi:hypothetical protein